MPHRVRMSPVDTAWLRMDSPGNLMMIVGVDVFDGPCDEPRLRKVLQAHLLPYFRFRARVVEDATGKLVNFFETERAEFPGQVSDGRIGRFVQGLDPDLGGQARGDIYGDEPDQERQPGQPNLLLILEGNIHTAGQDSQPADTGKLANFGITLDQFFVGNDSHG